MKINQRLVTVGCSFTFYKWLTWADFLSKHFVDFKNYGIPGADNETITRVVTNLTEPNDVVVAMWTGYERKNLNLNYSDTYSYSANHSGGSFINDKEYFVKYFNQYERFLTTLDCLKYAYTDSVHRKYLLYNFSAFDIDRGEMSMPVTEDLLKIKNERKFYFDQVVVPSEQEYCKSFEQKDEDPHPTPEAHYEFYKNIICPILKLTPMEYYED